MEGNTVGNGRQMYLYMHMYMYILYIHNGDSTGASLVERLSSFKGSTQV